MSDAAKRNSPHLAMWRVKLTAGWRSLFIQSPEAPFDETGCADMQQEKESHDNFYRDM
jgi:hypothetical protein